MGMEPLTDPEKPDRDLEQTDAVLDLLERWGSESRFVRFWDIDRQTGIERGLLRNILNRLKKAGEVKKLHGQNKRVFFVLPKYYRQCRDAELNSKSGGVVDRHGKPRGLNRTQKSMERTRRRIEKQQKRREVKLFSRARHRRKTGS